MAFVERWSQSLGTVVFLLLLAVFALSDARVLAYHAAEPLFTWAEQSWIGAISNRWSSVFAVVEAFHLAGLALLGGGVFLGDGRLLGLWLKEFPNDAIQHSAHKLFQAGLILLVATGLFMACAVAMKVYYLDVFWYKMLALLVGVFFTYRIRRPLLLATGTRSVERLVAVASLMVWFTVAACGRWIGFSG